MSHSHWNCHSSARQVPDSVPINTRNNWCIYQRQNCPEVCGGQAYPNNCSVVSSHFANSTNLAITNTLIFQTALTYTCTCTDGSKPNISSYANMLPSLICIQWVKDCVKAAGNDLQQLTNCRSISCGNKDPGKVAQNGGSGSGSGSGSSSSAAPSGSASATSGGGSSGASQTSSSSSSATSSGAAIALNVARSYGTSVLAAGMLAAFGLAL